MTSFKITNLDRAHQHALGKKPVMLYQVKWVGWEETTWEPVSSFPDKEVIEAYWTSVEARKAARAAAGVKARQEVEME